jgi:hypothetical protein
MEPAGRMYRLRLAPRRTTAWLFGILAALLAMHLWMVFCHLVLHWRVEALTLLVDLDLESNLPTFYNAMLFFFGAGLFFLHGMTSSAEQRRGWKVMAAVFTFLGVDEGSQVHEKFMQFTQRLLHMDGSAGGGGGWFFYAWVIPYGLAGLGLALVLGRWFFRLDPPVRRGLLLGGAVYVFGAVIMEMAAGKMVGLLPYRDPSEFPWLPCGILDDPAGCYLMMEPRYIVLYTLEEVGEMTGLILCIRTLLQAFEARGSILSIGLDRP